jgi:hypothetical protein
MGFNLLDRGHRHQIGTKLEDDKLLVKTVVEDQDVLANTRALRQAEAIRTGDKAIIAPDGAEMVYGFQIEPNLWKKFKKDRPDIYQDLTSGSHIRREKAAAKIAQLHPEWILFAPQAKPVINYAKTQGSAA